MAVILIEMSTLHVPKLVAMLETLLELTLLTLQILEALNQPTRFECLNNVVLQMSSMQSAS
jgi:hypothetical protein